MQSNFPSMTNHVYIDFIARLACTLSICNQLSPLPTFISAMKQKQKITSISEIYVATTLINGLIWFAYGVKVEDPSIMFANLFCCIMCNIYLFLLNKINAQWQNYMKYLYVSLIILLVLFLYGTNRILGQLGCIVSFLQYFSLSFSLSEALKTKEEKYINLTVTLMTTFGCAAWSIYGSMVKDRYVFLPNLLGVLISIFQIVVYLWIVDVINVNGIKSVINQNRQKSSKFMKSIIINGRNSKYLPEFMRKRIENLEEEKKEKEQKKMQITKPQQEEEEDADDDEEAIIFPNTQNCDSIQIRENLDLSQNTVTQEQKKTYGSIKQAETEQQPGETHILVNDELMQEEQQFEIQI